jgi:hypothetical protein
MRFSQERLLTGPKFCSKCSLISSSLIWWSIPPTNTFRTGSFPRGFAAFGSILLPFNLCSWQAATWKWKKVVWDLHLKENNLWNKECLHHEHKSLIFPKSHYLIKIQSCYLIYVNWIIWFEQNKCCYRIFKTGKP